MRRYICRLEAQKQFRHHDIPLIDQQLEQAFKSRRTREGSDTSSTHEGDFRRSDTRDNSVESLGSSSYKGTFISRKKSP